MKNPNIITRSSYTFFNSLLKIEDIINLTLSNGFKNAFLVDKNIMYGSMEFYNLCLKNNIKPIIGLEIEYKDIHKVLLAKNFEGYKELMKISSDINIGNNLNINYENLIDIKLQISPVLYRESKDEETLKYFQSISKKEFNQKSTGFLNREEFLKIYGDFILKEVDDIIDQINYKIEFKENILPSFKIDSKKVNSQEFLKDLLKKNLVNFLNSNKKLSKQKYIDRLSYEISIIEKMKFESYFLIVWDIVKWSKENNIFVGPGRGSASGSLISFLLNITEVDPIAHDLIFERFLNPDRITMPDIDIDFEDTRRDEVIKYIKDKYGKNHVAQIITFQKLRAKMSFRDIARIKGLSAIESNNITKLISEDLTLEESFNKIKSFKNKINSSEKLLEIYESAKLIEGLPRQFSTHAAGIVISDNEISSLVPIQKGFGDMYQTQYSMEHMEKNGLLKIDILGLRNLSFLKETINLIYQNSKNKIDLNKIDFNDRQVYKMFSSGKTSGIFQFESPGMKKALMEINISNFEDIVASTSLFRPGPMKNIAEFARRKNNFSLEKNINNNIDKILHPTYGIIVYQEQIIKIVQEFSNFTLSKADILRRAIGKKDIKLLSSLKQDFYNGALEKGHSKDAIEKMYNHIFEFSNYGFNRSHAFSYSIISYWLAWLKINYPLEFMTSLLNSCIGNISKTSEYINEIQDMNIKILQPSILKSKGLYSILNNSIYIGFKSIKQIGDSIVRKLIETQNNISENISLIDLFIELDKNGITKINNETLIKTGSFDSFGYNKTTLLSNLESIYKYIDMIKIKKEKTISYDKTIIIEPKIKKYDPSNNEKNYFSEVFGFSLFDKSKLEKIKLLEKKYKINKFNFTKVSHNENVTFIGEILSVKKITTKTGHNMAFALAMNGSQKINLTFWPATYLSYASILSPTKQFIFYGKADLKVRPTIIVNKIEVIK